MQWLIIKIKIYCFGIVHLLRTLQNLLYYNNYPSWRYHFVIILACRGILGLPVLSYINPSGFYGPEAAFVYIYVLYIWNSLYRTCCIQCRWQQAPPGMLLNVMTIASFMKALLFYTLVRHHTRLLPSHTTYLTSAQGTLLLQSWTTFYPDHIGLLYRRQHFTYDYNIRQFLISNKPTWNYYKANTRK